MNFKDTIAADIDNVFLNSDEFGEPHIINDQPVTCIMDTDSASAFSSDEAGDVAYVQKTRLYIKQSALINEPVQGKILRIDGTPYLVLSISREIGILVIELADNSPH